MAAETAAVTVASERAAAAQRVRESAAASPPAASLGTLFEGWLHTPCSPHRATPCSRTRSNLSPPPTTPPTTPYAAAWRQARAAPPPLLELVTWCDECGCFGACHHHRGDTRARSPPARRRRRSPCVRRCGARANSYEGADGWRPPPSCRWTPFLWPELPLCLRLVRRPAGRWARRPRRPPTRCRLPTRCSRGLLAAFGRHGAF